MPSEIHARMKFQKKLMGHLAPVYCVCYDQTGQFIFTGADDHLIKIWSARDGRLLKTLRGHNGEITDMSVNWENRLLASGGLDNIIRIWDLKTSKLLECLHAHQAMITSVKFAPYNRKGEDRYLISTSNDGSVVFWVYNANTFGFKKHRRYKERNRPGGRIICSSFSTGGSFLACGSSDNFIHVYGFDPYFGPYPMIELSNHSDQVDSIQFCNQGFKFITGSADGTAVIWSFRRSTWHPSKLDMNTQLDGTVIPTDETNRQKVLIVQWSRDDRYVMTAIADYSIKVWDSKTGQLKHVLKGHQNDVFLIESHPVDPRIFVSADHNGLVKLWDLIEGKELKTYSNLVTSPETGEGIRAGIYDIKFSPDGNMMAATDSYGYLILFGTGSGDIYKDLPEQMFFHTDYRGLIRDLRHFVMDDQTHLAPHLMPRPNLVDMNGDTYPAAMQRFVPDYKNGERIVIPPLSDKQINQIGEVIAGHSRLEDEEFIYEKRDTRDDYTIRNSSNDSFNSQFNSEGPSSRYNTRYSTRLSFRNARNNFLPRAHSRRSVIRDNEDDDDEDYSPRQELRRREHRHQLRRRHQRQHERQRRQLRQRQQQQQQRSLRQSRGNRLILEHNDSTTEADDDMDETDEYDDDEEFTDDATEVNTDDGTEIYTDANDTEMDTADDDETIPAISNEETEVDSDETEIDSDATEIDVTYLNRQNNFNQDLNLNLNHIQNHNHSHSHSHSHNGHFHTNSPNLHYQLQHILTSVSRSGRPIRRTRNSTNPTSFSRAHVSGSARRSARLRARKYPRLE